MEDCFAEGSAPVDPLHCCCCFRSTVPPEHLQTSEKPHPRPIQTALKFHLSGHTYSRQILSCRQEITCSLSHRLSAPASASWSQQTDTHHKQLPCLGLLYAGPDLPCLTRSSTDIQLLPRTGGQSGQLSRTASGGDTSLFPSPALH